MSIFDHRIPQLEINQLAVQYIRNASAYNPRTATLRLPIRTITWRADLVRYLPPLSRSVDYRDGTPAYDLLLAMTTLTGHDIITIGGRLRREMESTADDLYRGRWFSDDGGPEVYAYRPLPGDWSETDPTLGIAPPDTSFYTRFFIQAENSCWLDSLLKMAIMVQAGRTKGDRVSSALLGKGGPLSFGARLVLYGLFRRADFPSDQADLDRWRSLVQWHYANAHFSGGNEKSEIAKPFEWIFGGVPSLSCSTVQVSTCCDGVARMCSEYPPKIVTLHGIGTVRGSLWDTLSDHFTWQTPHNAKDKVGSPHNGSCSLGKACKRTWRRYRNFIFDRPPGILVFDTVPELRFDRAKELDFFDTGTVAFAVGQRTTPHSDVTVKEVFIDYEPVGFIYHLPGEHFVSTWRVPGSEGSNIQACDGLENGRLLWRDDFGWRAPDAKIVLAVYKQVGDD